jgi:hypothetical protein
MATFLDLQPEAVDESLRKGATPAEIRKAFRQTARIQDLWASGAYEEAEEAYAEMDVLDDIAPQLYYYHVLRL